MPGAYTAGSFNLGRDISMSFVIAGQTYRYVGLVTDTKRTANSKLHEVVPTNNDAVPVFRTSYEGYTYDVTITRQDGTFDALVDALISGYYNGNPPPVVTANETIRNPNQAQTADQWQLIGAAIVPESLGSFKGADPVNDVTFKLRFAQRIPIAGGGASAQSINNTNPFG